MLAAGVESDDAVQLLVERELACLAGDDIEVPPVLGHRVGRGEERKRERGGNEAERKSGHCDVEISTNVLLKGNLA